MKNAFQRVPSKRNSNSTALVVKVLLGKKTEHLNFDNSILIDFFFPHHSDMRYMLDGIFERAGVIRNMKIDQKRLLTDRISNTENQLMLVTREMKLKIHNMVEEVEQKVSKALNEEIWRLGVLVDEFNMPFHTEPLVLNVYKKEINSHVELGLGSNLRARLSTALAMNVETAQREMTGTF